MAWILLDQKQEAACCGPAEESGCTVDVVQSEQLKQTLVSSLRREKTCTTGFGWLTEQEYINYPAVIRLRVQ